MKKLDKNKLLKAIYIFEMIVTLACYIASIATQLIEHDTTQALCWLIAGTLVGATKVVEVK